jgi:hypothetical protein
MKPKQILLFFILTSLFFSCKSDKQKIEEAKQVVETFVKDLELENFQTIKNTYPSFSKIKGRFWILYQFKITDSKIENDEVTIYGNYKQYDKTDESIMFVLKANGEGGKYIIDRTKGLSAYFGTNVYTFFKTIGCLRGLETDEEIALACKKREVVFNNLVTQAAIAQQESVIMENHSISNSYGYLSGDITVKNTSNTTIPAFSYDVYIVHSDNNGNTIFKEKSISNVYKIPAQGSITIMVHQPYLRGMARIGIEFKLTKTDWLESDIANDPSKEITCEKIDEIIKAQL